MARYKWDSAVEWLTDKAQGLARNNDSAELLSIINTLASGIDNDTVQDHFQSEMEEDGFFTDLDKEKDAVEALSREQCIAILENNGFQCYDRETDEELQAAILANLADGTIDFSEVEEA